MNQAQQVQIQVRRWLRAHHSVISLDEARRLGAPDRMARTKAKNGEWDRMYRGVYRDASAPRTPYQPLRAAFVIVGRGVGHGVISHTSAAWLWGLLGEAPLRPELTIPAGSAFPGERLDLTVHRSRDLDLSRAATRQTLLVTNPLRTLVDLAGTVALVTLTGAVDAALASKLITIAGLEAEIDRLARRGRPGPAALRAHLLDRGFIGAPRPSVLEAKMQRLLVDLIPRGVPLPAAELHAGRDGEYRLDFAWPAIWLVIEVDGYVWHFSPEHTERDTTRRRHLQDLGWTVRVYTWREVVDEPSRVAREIIATYQRCVSAHRDSLDPAATR